MDMQLRDNEDVAGTWAPGGGAAAARTGRAAPARAAAARAPACWPASSSATCRWGSGTPSCSAAGTAPAPPCAGSPALGTVDRISVTVHGSYLNIHLCVGSVLYESFNGVQ